MNNNYQIVDSDFILDAERKYVLRVKDMPDFEKPREKLLKNGPDSLSSAELLAIILNTGTKKEEVLAMSQRVFKEYGAKTIVYQKDPQALAKELDIPIIKSCQIIACFELGKRFFSKNNSSVSIRSPKDAFKILKDMSNLKKEYLKGIYLNSRYQVLHEEIISIGSLTSNIVHPREVFGPALQHTAVAVIVAHNHPSGSLKPTDSDIEITKKLIEAGKVLGIELLDHLIIAKNKYSSILEEDGFYENELQN